MSADSPRYWRRESPPYSNRGRHVLPTGGAPSQCTWPVHHAHGPLLAHVTSAGPSRALRWLGVTSVSPSVTAHRPAAFELVPTARASERHRSGPAEWHERCDAGGVTRAVRRWAVWHERCDAGGVTREVWRWAVWCGRCEGVWRAVWRWVERFFAMTTEHRPVTVVGGGRWSEKKMGDERSTVDDGQFDTGGGHWAAVGSRQPEANSQHQQPAVGTQHLAGQPAGQTSQCSTHQPIAAGERLDRSRLWRLGGAGAERHQSGGGGTVWRHRPLSTDGDQCDGTGRCPPALDHITGSMKRHGPWDHARTDRTGWHQPAPLTWPLPPHVTWTPDVAVWR